MHTSYEIVENDEVNFNLETATVAFSSAAAVAIDVIFWLFSTTDS